MCQPLFLLIVVALLSNTASAIEQYSYKVIDKKPQPPDTWVQGLEIVDGQLYVGTGLRGKSSIQRFDFATGQLDIERKLDARLFGEGVTVLGDHVYQLTWRARLLLVYNKSDLTGTEYMRIPGEGWGLTNNGKQLIYSDGSSRLYFLAPEEHRITGAITVSENGRPLARLNELEWVNGRIWANVWQTDRIVIIDPANGEVEASINLQGLLPVMERRPGTDVLNGIAINPADGGIWVTGKKWPWLYRIELVQQPAQGAVPEANTR